MFYVLQHKCLMFYVFSRQIIFQPKFEKKKRTNLEASHLLLKQH